MKRIFKTGLVALFIGLVAGVVNAKEPKVELIKEGFYRQNWDYMAYVVDPKTQSCFFYYNQGTALMSCADLAKREEWKPIITWVR